MSPLITATLCHHLEDGTFAHTPIAKDDRFCALLNPLESFRLDEVPLQTFVDISLSGRSTQVNLCKIKRINSFWRHTLPSSTRTAELSSMESRARRRWRRACRLRSPSPWRPHPLPTRR